MTSRTDPIAPPKLTRKGAATRARLVAAASRVFAELGFLQARITDITKAADAANGTFYVYFDSKEDILRAVFDDIIADFLDMLREGRPVDADPVALIDHDNKRYLVAYRKHAGAMRVLEQVATFNDEFAALRRSVRDRFVARAERSIAQWQHAGLCDPDFAPHITAALLVAMVDNFTYTWLGLGDSHDADQVAKEMTSVWVKALGLNRRGPDGRDDTP
ncbi:TetR/AcrR family transcriptional regulator [Streptomyces sp. NPDC005231]|uniref:TetR/AcrR family transcriptional regulator n=1 Tax=Streptomyces sp. NPDC005231 TaxID=3157026 RepID=UPI0033B29B0B